MTIPAAANWCPACEETCHDHASVCTVCGTSLTAHPPRRNQRSNSNNNSNNNTIRALPTLMEVMPEFRQANLDLHDMIGRIRQQIDQADAEQTRLLRQLQQIDQDHNGTDQEEWQTAPAEWLDPAAAATTASGGGKPTSKTYLDALPRTVLREHSSILFQTLVGFQTTSTSSSSLSKSKKTTDAWTIEGTLGDFNVALPSNPFELQAGAQVILASPTLTGRGGLSPECCARIQQRSSSSSSAMTQQQQRQRQRPVLLYFDRGDNMTFVQKAALAQGAGAAACLIGNHVVDPWPYIMKDSKAEAAALDLQIPTVLLPKHAATKLKNLFVTSTDVGQEETVVAAHLDIRQATTRGDCVVCTESFVQGATVIRLPDCGHMFHEACAMPWLLKHNTCMYCRRELPTDDQEYERERRRTQRTHAGSAPQQSTEFNNFYS